MSLFEHSSSLNLSRSRCQIGLGLLAPCWRSKLLSLGGEVGPRAGNGQLGCEDVACMVFRSSVASGLFCSPWGEPGWMKAPVAWI